MEGLILAEYLVMFYFLVMCLIIVGVAAIRALGCFNICLQENNSKDVIHGIDNAGPSVYNIPWQHRGWMSTDISEIISEEAVPKIQLFPESTSPCYVTSIQTGNESLISEGFTPIYASPFALPGPAMSQTPVYASLSSLGLRPKTRQTPIYASPQFTGSRYSIPIRSQTPLYASPSFVGPRYAKPYVQPVPGVHYKVPQNPRIAALKEQSAVARSMSPCRFTVNGDLYAQVIRKKLHPGMNQDYRPKQQLIYTF